jgi:hypothetical protein
MDKTTFKMFLEKMRRLIERQDTKLREAISAAERLAVTLIVTTDTLSKFSLTKFLMENFDSDNGPLESRSGSHDKQNN